MNQTMLALVVGLLAGVGGSLVATQFSSSDGGGSIDGEGTDVSEIILRLDRLEAAINRPELRGTPSLSGAGGEASSGSSATLGNSAQLDALVAKLEERLKPTIQESVKTSMNEAMASGSEFAFSEAMPAKKEVTLAEAAAELELTAEEEEAVRRIAKETSEEFLKVIAGKDGNVDDIRRDLEEAKDDPKKRIELTTKYMGKVMTNIGGLLAVGMTHEQKMRDAIGAEKARKLDENYKVSDLDPLGLETVFDFD